MKGTSVCYLINYNNSVSLFRSLFINEPNLKRYFNFNKSSIVKKVKSGGLLVTIFIIFLAESF